MISAIEYLFLNFSCCKHCDLYKLCSINVKFPLKKVMIYDENPRISLEIWINFQTHRWGSVVTCITCWLWEVLLKFVKFLIFALNKWLNSLNIFINAILAMGRRGEEPCQEQVLSHCKIKLQSSIYNSPLFSCCLLYMHTKTKS